jgi:Caspase domain
MQKNRASGLNIIIVDACRDELPISDAPKTIPDRIGTANNRIASRGGGDLTSQSAADPLGPDLSGGTIIVYSTEVNGVALDGLRGAHSPFATAFVDTVTRPGIEIRDVFNEIGSRVQNSSNDNAMRQIPWVYQSPIKQAFYLGGRPSMDPRKELAAMRYGWGITDFFDAIERRDYKAVELFLVGGMKMNNVAAGSTDFKMFLYKNYFDQRIAALILYYNAIDPNPACPVPPNSMYASYKFYTEIPERPEVSTFIMEVCRQESVRAKFDAALERLKNDADAEMARKASSQEYQRRDAARPRTSAMGQAMKGITRQYERELGPETESSVAQLTGWAEARRLLWGSQPPSSVR